MSRSPTWAFCCRFHTLPNLLVCLSRDCDPFSNRPINRICLTASGNFFIRFVKCMIFWYFLSGALQILGFGEYIGEVQAAYEQHKNETLVQIAVFYINLFSVLLPRNSQVLSIVAEFEVCFRLILIPQMIRGFSERLSYQGFGGFLRGDQSLSKDPLLRFDYVSQWECCGRWLLPCRLLWMAPGQMACHHLASATCVILLLLFHSSSWLLSFDCLRLSVQLWKLCMNYLSRFLYCGSLGYLVLWTSMVTKDN
jgi:hypothetical protein